MLFPGRARRDAAEMGRWACQGRRAADRGKRLGGVVGRRSPMKQLIKVDICKCTLRELFNPPRPSESTYRVAANVGQLLCCWQQQQWAVVLNTHSSRSPSGWCLATEDTCLSSSVCTCHPNKGSSKGVSHGTPRDLKEKPGTVALTCLKFL